MPSAPIFRATAVRLLVLAALHVPAGAAVAAPSADPWPRWEAHAAGSELTVNHDPWDAILAEVVRLGDDGVARVDYPALTEDPLHGQLDGYLAQLAGTPSTGWIAPSSRRSGSISTTRSPCRSSGITTRSGASRTSIFPPACSPVGRGGPN